MNIYDVCIKPVVFTITLLTVIPNNTDDGKLKMKVLSTTMESGLVQGKVTCEVIVGGALSNRKGEKYMYLLVINDFVNHGRH